MYCCLQLGLIHYVKTNFCTLWNQALVIDNKKSFLSSGENKLIGWKIYLGTPVLFSYSLASVQNVIPHEMLHIQPTMKMHDNTWSKAAKRFHRNALRGVIRVKPQQNTENEDSSVPGNEVITVFIIIYIDLTVAILTMFPVSNNTNYC